MNRNPQPATTLTDADARAEYQDLVLGIARRGAKVAAGEARRFFDLADRLGFDRAAMHAHLTAAALCLEHPRVLN